MSPRFKPTFGLSLIISGTLCLIVYAAHEVANLKFRGEPLPKLGGAHCDSDEKVDVELPPTVLNKNQDFRYTFSKIKDNESKSDKACPEKISATLIPKEKPGDEPNEFIKGNQKISIKKFLPPSACKGETGEGGSRVLCIYEYEGTELELLAQATFSYDTRKAKFNKVTDRTAVNAEIRFKVDYTPGSGGKIEVETCYGEGSEEEIIKEKDKCPAGFHTDKSWGVEVSITKNIKNHTEYALKVRVKEGDNQPSKWSDPFTLKPVPATFPLKMYRGAGGDVEYTCQQSGPSSWLILCLTLVSLWLLRLRHRKVFSSFRFIRQPLKLSLILFFVAIPDPAHAEMGQMNVGLLGSMYRPALDSEKLSSGESIFPFYKNFFRRKTADKEGPINPLMGLEFDWHLWDDFGSLQLGVGLGYTFITGHALELDANNQPDDKKPISHAKVALHMYQIRPQLTYIFNPYVDYVPLVPYARAALIAHGYSFLELGKNVSETNADGKVIKPNGIRFGYQAALGLMLRLDFLDRGAVRSARSGGLFDHIYLKSELSFTKIDGFGTKGFQFSPKDVMGTGLPLMWTFGLVFELL